MHFHTSHQYELKMQRAMLWAKLYISDCCTPKWNFKTQKKNIHLFRYLKNRKKYKSIGCLLMM